MWTVRRIIGLLIPTCRVGNEKIAGIQEATAAAVSEMEKISQTNRDVNEIVVAIASSINEQAKVTRNIAEVVTAAIALDILGFNPVLSV